MEVSAFTVKLNPQIIELKKLYEAFYCEGSCILKTKEGSAPAFTLAFKSEAIIS